MCLQKYYLNEDLNRSFLGPRGRGRKGPHSPWGSQRGGGDGNQFCEFLGFQNGAAENRGNHGGAHPPRVTTISKKQLWTSPAQMPARAAVGRDQPRTKGSSNNSASEGSPREHLGVRAGENREGQRAGGARRLASAAESANFGGHTDQTAPPLLTPPPDQPPNGHF